MKQVIAGFVLILWPFTVPCAASAQTLSENGVTDMRVHYLEIVTPKVDETCAVLEAQHGVTFGTPEASFGNARLAMLESGGRIGVRAPLHDDEEPVVRPYLLVEDIEAASTAAEAAGAEFAMRATEMPGQGKFAIYMLGGIEHGLWEQ